MRPLALITGASAGIGAAFARRLAADGNDLVLVARHLGRLEEIAVQATRAGAHCQIIVTDLATRDGVTAMLDEIDALCDRPFAIAILNAGVTHAAAVGTTDHEQAERIVTLLATGVMHTAERLIPPMIAAGGGRVVVVSSIAAFTPMRKSAIYAASKAFVTSYVRSLSLEVRGTGVNVSAVCPGYVRTDLHERAGLGHLRRTVPSILWLEAEQVVNASMKAVSVGRAVVVPGLIYRVTRPFLTLRSLQRMWGGLTRRPARNM